MGAGAGRRRRARPGRRVELVERNLLLGGEPGAGKSAALSLLVASAALGSVGAAVAARRQAGRAVGVGAVRAAPRGSRRRRGDRAAPGDPRRRWRQRYRELLARGARKITPSDGLPLHLVACDELAFYLGAEDRKQQREFAELLRDLVARGRAAGVIVCAATQKPAADVVPSALRDLFGFRLALRCNTPQASDTILGQGWATSGIQRRVDRARAARRRAAAGRGRHCRCACAAFISTTRTSTRSPRGRARCAPTRWLDEEGRRE